MRECDVIVTRSKGPVPHAPAFSNMIWIPGATFRMGSDKHYPEEPRSIASPSTASGSTVPR
jgi:hypothetical protein